MKRIIFRVEGRQTNGRIRQGKVSMSVESALIPLERFAESDIQADFECVGGISSPVEGNIGLVEHRGQVAIIGIQSLFIRDVDGEIECGGLGVQAAVSGEGTAEGVMAGEHRDLGGVRSDQRHERAAVLEHRRSHGGLDVRVECQVRRGLRGRRGERLQQPGHEQVDENELEDPLEEARTLDRPGRSRIRLISHGRKVMERGLTG